MCIRDSYQYAYDGSGNLASVTYPPATQTSALCPNTTLPNTSTYTYDSNHLYTGGTDALCHVPVSYTHLDVYKRQP